MKNFNNSFVNKVLAIILLWVILLGNSVSFAVDNVNPDVNESIEIWGSFIENKEVLTPKIPPKLDVMFLFDTSWSFYDDLPNIKWISASLYDDIAASGSDFRLAVSSFIDYPVFPFWDPLLAYPFNLEQNFTNDKSVWTWAIDWLSALDWADYPESQYDAIVSAVSSVTWRDDAKHIVVIATDASFHNPDDTWLWFTWVVDYPWINWSVSTITALNDLWITLIWLKWPFYFGDPDTLQLEELADATWGEVLPIDSTSTNISDAILEWLWNLPVTVYPDASACWPLEISFSPNSQTVISWTVANFEETIIVPEDHSLEWTTVSCEVLFNDENDNFIGKQEVVITIPDITAPVVECLPTVNPAWKNIPKAWEKSKWQNEDWFYQLIAKDNVDRKAMIYVNWFWPYENLDNLKITEAPWSTPTEKKIWNSTDGVLYYLILDSDAEVIAVDASWNESEPVSCLVPPMPK